MAELRRSGRVPRMIEPRVAAVGKPDSTISETALKPQVDQRTSADSGRSEETVEFFRRGLSQPALAELSRREWLEAIL